MRPDRHPYVPSRRPRLAVLLLLAWLAWPGAAAAQSVAFVVPPAGPAREAWQALEDGRYKDAQAAFERALRAKPDDAACLLGAGIVWQRLGQAAQAREAFTEALRIDPALMPASVLLGLLLYETGELPGAIRTYEAALVRAPGSRQLTVRLEQWRKEAALQRTFLQAQGNHFTVLFEGPSDEVLARRAVGILEAAYERVGTALLTFPIEPITVLLYTQEQFSDITRSPGWSGGLFDGRIRLPMRGALGDPRELERVLTHEYVHALVYSIAPRGVPVWLNEGLAGVFERGGVERARRDVEAAGVSGLPSLEALSGSFGSLPADQVRTAYAASTLAVKSLIDRAGPLAITALMTDLAGGTPLAEAFVNRAQIPFQDFDAEWRAALAR